MAGAAAGGGTTVAIGPAGAPVVPPSILPPSDSTYPIQIEAQNRLLDGGKSITKEEHAKRIKDPFAMWDEIGANAALGQYPKGTDVFLDKYSGLFQVAPAQNSFMSRLRFAGGVLPSWQFRGVADLARRFGGGYVDMTTRGNLQIREILAPSARDYLVGLADLGIINKGAGADNIRNVTAGATSGIDPQEFIDCLPLARAMHHDIINHKESYGLPRKFNIAFEGGGKIASLDETNDVGFRAVRINDSEASADPPAGVYFRLTLGGITGHLDFARDTGVLLKPDECVAVAGAVVRVFARHGDRTDRKKARLKSILDSWGFPRFTEEVEKEWGQPLRRRNQG